MYTPEERQIFRFFDGSHEVAADPLQLWCDFVLACQGEHQVILEKTQSKSDIERAEALPRAAFAARAAFRLDPYDRDTGTGLTDTQVLGLLFKFLEWCQEKKWLPG